MNLLTDNWIPVKSGGVAAHIGLKQLLCSVDDWQLASYRDDMELAALQLIVCLVQVVFMPDDADALFDSWEKPMAEEEYEKGIASYLDWFDLLHPTQPFMQNATVTPEPKRKNWSSLQKLFVGLPEVTSSSPSSNAFFNSVDEIKSAPMCIVAIALFQQATNGFSLGGAPFSVGLKGSMPLTTLIIDSSLRKSVWCNVLSKDFIKNNSPQILNAGISEPVWITPPHAKVKEETSLDIGLCRGLFWQPAKIKIESVNNLATGFLKKPGTCSIKGFWQHPHTPIDLSKITSADKKDKPYISARNDLPLWDQLLCFFYSRSEISTLDNEGAGHALVVRQYREVWAGRSINLAVGGYVKGNSTESLAGRRHEIFSLDSGWESGIEEFRLILEIGTKSFQALDMAIGRFGKIAIEHEKKRKSEARLKNGLRKKGKQLYFKNSEKIVHSFIRKLNASDIGKCKEGLSATAKYVYDMVVDPYRHEPKMLRAIVEGRKLLSEELNQI